MLPASVQGEIEEFLSLQRFAQLFDNVLRITDDKIMNDHENTGLERIIPDENLREEFINQFDILIDAGDQSTFDEEPSSKIPRMDPTLNGNAQIKNNFVESTPFGNSFLGDDSSQICGATPKDLSFDECSSIGSTARPPSPIKPSQDVFEDSILNETEIKPIQILQIKNSNVTLDTETLSQMFSKNPDRQIGVICMTGAAKTGKSFFLNYVLRFLKWSAQHDDNKTSTPHDWYDIKFADVPCEGFEWGKNKKTKGVWIWPKPFSFKQGIDGEEIDVFIMDIEGIFNINSSSPSSMLSSKFELQPATTFESAVLLGFSLLASSFLVLNIEDFCGKHDKSHYFRCFESFISHEQESIAIDYNPSELPTSSAPVPPFQKLLFLIRDWKKPGELQYGSADGHKYLSKAFGTSIPDYFSSEDKDAREKFRNFFSHTNAVLLPHPGEESLKPNSLGNFQQLEKNFSAVLRKSINSKFNPMKKIPAKRFKGNIIKGPELVSMLSHFVNLIKRNPKLLTDKLMDFNIYRKIVNSFDAKKQMKNLGHIEQKDLKHIPQQQKQDVQASLKSSCESLLNSFKHLMTQHFPSDGKTFQSTDEIARLLQFAQDFVHNMSIPLFSTYSDKQQVQDHLNNLFNLITIEKEKILAENTLRREEAEKLIRNEIEQLLNSYKSKFQSYYLMENKSLVFLKDEDFKMFNDSLKGNCLEEFKTKFHDHILFPLASKHLSVEIESLSSNLSSIVAERRKEQIGRICGARDVAIQQYEGALIKFYGDSTKEEGNTTFFDESTLLNKHEQEKSISIGFLLQFINNFSPPFDQVENGGQLKTIEMEVLSEINRIFELYKLKNEQRKNIFLSQIQNSFYASKECYTNKMKQLINNLTSDNNSTSSLDENNFHQEEKVVRSFVLENFNNSIKSKFPNPNQDIIKSFKEKLEDYMNKELNEVYLCAFITKKEEDEFAVRQALFCASLFYNEQMDKHFTNKDSLYIKPEELNCLNEKITTAALQHCQENNLVAESNTMRKRSLTPRQENELVEGMKLLFKKYEEQNLRRLPDKNPSIGIDLGYTNSCVCVYLGGQVTVIPNENGKNTTPSYVHFSEDGSIVVGDAAKRFQTQFPTTTVYGVKRLIGRKFSQVQDDVKNFPFKVVDVDDVPYVQIRGKNYHPEEISAIILKKLKNIAESYLDMVVENCVITVPAQFNDAMRQATRDSGIIAGLNVLTLLNEPTSSAYSYQLHRTDDLKRNVVVFDLGGGTLDVAVLKINKGEIKVETVQGDNQLGGQDFDQQMVEYCVEAMKKEHQVVLSNCQLLKLREQCEEQKKNLSSAKTATTNLDLGGDKTVIVTFTRNDFEKMNGPKFQKCIEILEKALIEANMKKTEVDDIVLIGGSSRIPEIQKLLIDHFGKMLSKRINPDEAVAVGAAMHAALLTGQKMAQSPSGHTVGTVIEVANFNIGFETHNKKLSVVIPKNSVLPCEFVKTYYTIQDNQPRLRFNIYEGEKELAAENNLLGCFRVYDIPVPSEWGKNPIDVTLKLDVEGILTAKAVWRENQNISSEIRVLANKGRMTEEQIETAKARVDQNFFVGLDPAQ